MADDREAPLWQQHQSEEIMKVVTGLRDGDLAPLASYLEEGGLPESPAETVAVPAWLAREIASMIRGGSWHWYRLSAIAQKRGRGWSDDLETGDERFKLGFFVEKRIRELGPGAFESVLVEAQERFDVGRDKAARAVSHVRRYLRDAADLGVDGWVVLEAKYSDQTG